MENYYEILELSEDANLQELEEQYAKIKKLFYADNLAMYSVYNDEQIGNINKKIEKAYKVLKAKLKSGDEIKVKTELPEIPEEEKTVVEIPVDTQTDINIYATDIDGPMLKIIRESKGISLKEVSETIKLRMKVISDIEKNGYEDLPARVFVRGFVSNYARFLSLDSEKITNDYMKRYDDYMRNR